MKAGYLWLAAFAALPLAGSPLAFHPAYRRYGLFCRTALSAGIGAVSLSVTMTLATLVPLRWGVAWLLGASFALSWLLRLLVGPEPDAPRPYVGSRAAAAAAGLISATAVAAALFATFAAAASSTDLFHFWGPKAEAFAAARTIDAEFLRAPFHEDLHADYPPLVTNILAFASMAAGRLPWGAATYTFPLLLAMLAFALHGLLAADRPRAEAYPVAALVVSTAALLGVVFQVAGNGDPFLLFFEVCALGLLTGPDATRGSRLLLAGLFLAGASSAKVEGLPFVAAAVLLVAWTSPRQRTLRCAVFLLAPTAVGLATWLAFGWTRQLFRFYVGYGAFGTLHLENLPVILTGIVRELGLFAWGVGFLVPLAVLLLTRPNARIAWLPIGTALLLVVFSVFTYAHAVEFIPEWITWSAGRIFTPVALLLGLAALCRNRLGKA